MPQPTCSPINENKYHELDLHAAIIGGVAFPSRESCEELAVNTPYGVVTVNLMSVGKYNIAVLPRHAGEGRHVPPHMINYRANIQAIYELGVDRIISTNSVGTMKNHPVGSFFLPDDFIDFTKTRPSTFFNDRTVHVDVTEPYCPQIREVMRTCLKKRNFGFSEGVYVCTEGPRFETKAEIRMMRQFGDVVGMTGLPEVVLAKELNMCYASICTITNDACGISKGKMTVSEVLDILANVNDKLESVIFDVLKSLPKQHQCHCKDATADAGL